MFTDIRLLVPSLMNMGMRLGYKHELPEYLLHTLVPWLKARLGAGGQGNAVHHAALALV